MTLKVGDRIRYNAGKSFATILDIQGNSRHILYTLSDGNSQTDLEKKVGKPGGVEILTPLLPKMDIEIPMPPVQPPKEIVDPEPVIDVISAGLETNEPLTDEDNVAVLNTDQEESTSEPATEEVVPDQEDIGPEPVDPPKILEENEPDITLVEVSETQYALGPTTKLSSEVSVCDGTPLDVTETDGEAVEENTDEPEAKVEETVSELIDPDGPQLRYVDEGKLVEKP